MPDTKDILASIIRTWVPVIVGIVGPYVVKWIGLTDGQVTAITVAVVTAVYYAVVRVLETYVSPYFGALLGYVRQPVYTSDSRSAVSAGL